MCTQNSGTVLRCIVQATGKTEKGGSMSVKFNGFDYISDNDGMGIHVVAGADDI